jgi:hypothetical protein
VDYTKKAEAAGRTSTSTRERVGAAVEAAVGSTLVELVTGPLSVGMRGPAWVLSLLKSA